MALHLPEVVPQLLAAAPALRPTADGVQASPWHVERPEACFAALADPLGRLVADGETAQVPPLAATVEHQLADGDAVVRRHLGRSFLSMVQLAARLRRQAGRFGRLPMLPQRVMPAGRARARCGRS